jgi:hypothetical protein
MRDRGANYNPLNDDVIGQVLAHYEIADLVEYLIDGLRKAGLDVAT